MAIYLEHIWIHVKWSNTTTKNMFLFLLHSNKQSQTFPIAIDFEDADKNPGYTNNHPHCGSLLGTERGCAVWIGDRCNESPTQLRTVPLNKMCYTDMAGCEDLRLNN